MRRCDGDIVSGIHMAGREGGIKPSCWDRSDMVVGLEKAFKG